MTDPRFFQNKGPYRLSELARIGEARLIGEASPDLEIIDVAPLNSADSRHLSFFDNTKYLDDFLTTKAMACLVSEKFIERAPTGVALLTSEQPYRSYALIAQAFYPRREAVEGIHPAAHVDDKAVVDRNVEIGPNAVISSGAKINSGVIIGAGALIGENVEIGENSIIAAQVCLSHCLIGDRATIHAGARIGQDGFGFAPDPRGHEKVPQVGRVIIGDDCEIGANTTIDRGSLQDTIIGPGCWIDKLVQIGHNVQLGRGCIIVSQVGIAGSTIIGDFVALGGQVGLAGHLNIGSGAQVAAKSGVMTDIPPGQTFSGIPAVPIKESFRQIATLKKLSTRKGSKNND
jgi:UDP-3-O-[3-hydroxymyristoyl] glucosamine N-acyltransferase